MAVTPPPHLLDFIVLGVARSGTTILARSINLDPGLFCGIEYFAGASTLDYATLVMPDAFLSADHRASSPRNTAESRSLLRAKLETGQPLAYGNKLPSYHLVLDRINHQRPGLRNLCIYRSPRSFAESWDRRAADPRDDWPSGRIGLFGLCDWAILVARLSEARHDIRILDYETAFFHDAALFAEVLAYAGARPPAASTLDAFRAGSFRGGGAAPRAGGAYDALLDRHGIGVLEAAIAAARFAPAQALRDPLRAQAEASLGPLIAHAAEHVAASGDAGLLAYARRWAFMTFATFDNPQGWTFGALRPALIAFMERLAPLSPEAGLDDSWRMVDALIRREGGDPEAGHRLRASLPPRANGAGPQTLPAASAVREERGFLRLRDAQAFADAGDIDRAIAAAREGVALMAETMRGRFQLAKLLLRKGDVAEATALLGALVEEGFRDPAVHLFHSRGLARCGALGAAHAAVIRAAELLPGDPAVREWRELVQRRLEEGNAAVPADSAAPPG